ncbi:MAG: hypothetical protein U9R75_03070 [Candidatus Thermoplasmatota archaeon]|nr:hypothetical protein [Candidatus Thermoplasmatota archaeon]
MSRKKKQKDDGINVHFSDSVDDKKKAAIGNVMDIFQGPLFEQMVRDTVSEFCMEAKLIFDPETDEFYELEDHLKLIAKRLSDGEHI